MLPFFRSTAIALAAMLPLTGAMANSPIPEDQPKRIQVAFVLDTTGSMSGLLEGAKRKIWSIANNLKDLEPRPEIEFALIGYRDRGDDYVTKTYAMTDDLQDIYGKLVAFQAGGGGDTPESVNQALAEAVRDIAWSDDPEVFRVAFLVGDAPPHMDYKEDQYPQIVREARQMDIVINTIQAGSMQSTTPIWKQIASLGGGDYARIEQDGGMKVVETPFDGEIQRMTIELNKTVIPYGRRETRAQVRSKTAGALAASPSVASDMAAYISKSKSESKVVTGAGDLTEEIMSGRLDANSLEDEALPEEMQAMDDAERVEYVQQNIAKRDTAQAELDALVTQRDKWIADQRATTDEPADAFDRNVERMIDAQAASKGFIRK